ncbi:MAG: glycosyltransferase, partial [Phycisphaerales bacterium]|nr:glycosyltransferase [Phycisphaerales bacterium]
FVTAIPVRDEPTTPAWASFACALIRHDILREIGVLDPGFFLYFDDPDYCRRVRRAGHTVLNVPEARVVHLRGKSNPAKELMRQKKRRPWYHYASRTRYYAKHSGRLGLLAANLCWTTGHAIALLRRLLGGKEAPACEREARDIWTNFWRPMAMPERGQDG